MAADLRRLVVAALLALGTIAAPVAQTTIAYRLTFSEREHHLMEVEVTFGDVPAGTLELRMSRASPGRYAIHDFAKNVFDVRIIDAAGTPLNVTRPNPHQWNVSGHAGQVRVQYKVFGDRVDGTYLAIDSTHAHINMPAALMWARGLERRPVSLRFEQPAGTSWRVATQLIPAGDPFTYSAPNLQYLLDSPTEFSAFTLRTFTATDQGRTPVFRVAVHHAGTDADVDAFVRGVEEIVREARHVFREYPAFEGNTYTFIADYLPWANGDGMEHRNSTILTSARSLRDSRLDLLDTASHEFFHSWNIERIRPASLEPFNLEDANMSGELWFGEGFTNYYGPLVMRRAGLHSDADFATEMGNAVNAVIAAPGRQFRSAVEVSQLAPFWDAATSIDPTNLDNTFVSYYTWGQVIALGLDLALRDRSDSRITLDDFMRAMWTQFGTSASKSAGLVERPFTIADLKTTLAAVSGDAAFANDFFARYIEGRDVVDYAPLLSRAGFVLRRSAPGRAFAGAFPLQDAQRGARVADLVPPGSPAYAAGLERGDIIVSIGGTRVMRADDVDRALTARKPGETLPVTFERRGQQVNATLRLVEDPRVELVPAEQTGQVLSDAQRRFREAWLSSGGRNTF
jgi:predicted metalloprotease with PDZ domain